MPEKQPQKNSKKKIAYNNAWTNSHYDRINICIPMGGKARIKAAAEKAGQSVNAYSWQAIQERLSRESSAGTPEQ